MASRRGGYEKLSGEALADFCVFSWIRYNYRAEEKSAEFYFKQGVEHGKKGQYNQAIADFNKALKINPRDAEAYNNRGVAYYFKKNYDKAWKDVQRAQSLGYKVHPDFLKELRKASGRER